eukprot:scaffold1828_cov169-Amphora_coffeaeformis.AAC.23
MDLPKIGGLYEALPRPARGIDENTPSRVLSPSLFAFLSVQTKSRRREREDRHSTIGRCCCVGVIRNGSEGSPFYPNISDQVHLGGEEIISIMPGTTIDQIRHQVEALDKYELQEPFRESPRCATAVVDGSLLERYTNLRDEYLQKTIENTVASNIATFDGKKFEQPELPMQVELLQARRKEVQNKLQQTSLNVQNNWDQLQSDFARLRERKEDLRKMLEEFEGDGDSLDLGMDEDEQAVEEEDLQAQQERLLALQQRKKDLLTKLNRLQEEHRAVELENTENEANLSIVSYDSEAIAEIEKENQALREAIEANKEMAGYFETMRLVTEELSGIRIISVDEGESEGVDVVLRVEILHNHIIEIGLEADARKKEGLRVADARLITPPKVQVAVSFESTQTIELPIPNLDDLVALAQPQPRSKALAFVIQETVARIEMIHERADELCGLFTEQSIRVEKSLPSSNGFGRCDHEIICSLPENNIKVLLRMTPDCPRLPGSVYLDQITGPDGEDLDDILESTRKTPHQRPAELLLDVKKSLESRK